jgi:hypothetical protein
LIPLGENYEKVTKGFIDFRLLNDKGFPFIVLEAKSEAKHPLVGKEWKGVSGWLVLLLYFTLDRA